MPTNSFVKDIIVARAGRNFRNGATAFDLTVENIDEVIANFDRLKKQVPLLLTPDHVFGGKKSAIPASGWVERMYRDGDAWHAQVKFVGDAADYVRNDQFRGVSIGTVMAHDVHGHPAVGHPLSCRSIDHGHLGEPGHSRLRLWPADRAHQPCAAGQTSEKSRSPGGDAGLTYSAASATGA